MAWFWLKLLVAWLQSKLAAVLVIKADGYLAVTAIEATGSLPVVKAGGCGCCQNCWWVS